MGKLFGGGEQNQTRRGVSQTRPAGPQETHGGVPCPNGRCSTNSMRNDRLEAVPTGPNPAQGANRAMASIFRSCSAKNPIQTFYNEDANGRYSLNFNNSRRSTAYRKDGNTNERTVTNGATLAQNSPYARDVNYGECSMPQVDGQTVDMQRTPSLFQYTASLEYKNGQGMSPYRCSSGNPNRSYCGMGAGSQPAVALDCMEFVGLSMASACLKFSKNDNFKDPRTGIKIRDQYELSNRTVSYTLGESDACLENVPQNSTDFLQDGDIIFGSESPNHAAIITDVGSDPLGIEKALNSRGGCDNIHPKNFNFSLAQSSSVMSIGPIKSTANAYFWLKNRAQINNTSGNATLSTPFPLDILLVRARTMCQALERNPNTRSFPRSFSENHHLVRHKGGPECTMDDDECPKVIGDECADRCGPRNNNSGESWVGA